MDPTDSRAVRPRGNPTEVQYVYALGQISPRFPRLGVEKEYLQVLATVDSAGLTDRECLHKILSARDHRYIARLMAWVLTIEGIDTYMLVPRAADDLELLLAAIRPRPRAQDVDLVIGRRGGLSAPSACDGLVLPTVVFDQLYSFDVEALVAALPRPTGADPARFTAAAEELFRRVVALADNAGSDDEHRALNYLLVRCPGLYALTAEKYAENWALRELSARSSLASNTRTIVDVRCLFSHRVTGVTDVYIVRVDVTEEFPFLADKLQLSPTREDTP